MLARSTTSQLGQQAEKSADYSRGTGVRMGLLAFGVTAALIVGFRFVSDHRAQEVAALAQSTKAEASAPPPVDVVSVTPAASTRQLALPGETAAWYDSKIYARVNGYVSKWFVDIGDHVQDGQVLASIDTPEVDAELVAARAKLQAADAQVDVKQAEADFAKTTYDRWRDSPQGVVSQQERESKKAAYVGANAQLSESKAQVALDQAEVDRLTALTAFKQVKAPFEGTIVQRDIDIGDLVTAGSTSSTSSLYRISLDNPIRVFVHVPQAAALELLKGDAHAVITVGDGSGRRYDGNVSRTSKSINPQARTLRVEVDIPNLDADLVPGMYVNVAFTLATPGGVEVPAAALMFRPGPQAAVVNADGVVEFRDLKIGRDDGAVVQIAAGLKQGDRVALNLSSQIASGTKVEVHDLSPQPSGKVAVK